jgi:hypothetical protein
MGKKRSNANYRRNCSAALPRSLEVGGAQQLLLARLVPRLPVRHRPVHSVYCSEPRLACNPVVVVRYRMHLDGRGLAPTRSTSNWLRFEASHTKPPTPNVEPRAGCWDQPGERREAGRATLWELAECGAKLRSYSGMHGSWLNQVEIATSLFSWQCLGHAGSRIELLCGRKRGCGNRRVNRDRVTIQWSFTHKQARKKFGYRIAR